MKEAESVIDRILVEQEEIYPDLVFTKSVNEDGVVWRFADTRDQLSLPAKPKKKGPLLYLHINGYLRGFGNCAETFALKSLRLIRERYGIRKPREDE